MILTGLAGKVVSAGAERTPSEAIASIVAGTIAVSQNRDMSILL
jgi:hypothetical protein